MAQQRRSTDPSGDAADHAIEEHLQDSAQPRSSGDAGDDAVSHDIEELQKKAAERDEFLGLLQHLRADYANYQKRVQKEVDTARRYASQSLVVDLVAGIDNLERAMQSADAAAGSALLDGIRLVHQQLLAALARHGVHPIAAAGKPFDPEFHEALLEQPDARVPPRTVLQELQKGYTLHDRVIRPSKVIVSRGEPDAAPDLATTESPE